MVLTLFVSHLARCRAPCVILYCPCHISSFQKVLTIYWRHRVKKTVWFLSNKKHWDELGICPCRDCLTNLQVNPYTLTPCKNPYFVHDIDLSKSKYNISLKWIRKVKWGDINNLYSHLVWDSYNASLRVCTQYTSIMDLKVNINMLKVPLGYGQCWHWGWFILWLVLLEIVFCKDSWPKANSYSCSFLYLCFPLGYKWLLYDYV